jgi:N-acyl-D-amino-acid deacylase
MYDIIIKNGTLIDGSGERSFVADIGIKEGKIASIDHLNHVPAKQVIDAMGCMVTPGFIDVNNHSDTYWQIFSQPHLESLVYQGITTIVGGNCGSSLAPLADASTLQSIQKWTDIRNINLNWLSVAELLTEIERHKLSVNFATLSGQATIRRGLIKDAMRNLSQAEIDSLLRILKKSFKEGSFGCSLGLGYTHARHTSMDELLAVGSLVKKNNGVYSVHLRNESDCVLTALEEVADIAKKTKCRLHISHFKIEGDENYHLMEEALFMIDEMQSKAADISFDVYPYTATGTVLYTLLPEWVSEGGKNMMLERLKDKGIQHELILELRETQRNYETMVILSSSLTQLLPYQSIADLAHKQGISGEQAMLDILVASNGRAIVSMEVVDERNIEKALQHPSSIVSTNGAGYSLEHQEKKEFVHPRSFGTFPMVLSRFVEQKKILSWEEAIHKMTGKPAQKFGIEKRGILREGNYADIVVFHPSQLAAPASFENPYQYAKGMQWVLVNGGVSLAEGAYTKNRFGEVLCKSTSWF